MFSKSRAMPHEGHERQRQEPLKRRRKTQVGEGPAADAQISRQRAQEIEKQLEHITNGERYSI
jgi:hypothetical protein